MFEISTKKLLLGIFCVFLIVPAFGQEFVWTTITGSNVRTIQMSSVRQEVMRMYDSHTYFFFEEDENGNSLMSRTERKEVITGLLNFSLRDTRADTAMQQYRRQYISWLNNNRNFVFHSRIKQMVAVKRGGRTSFVEEYANRVVFVIGDSIMEVSFTNTEPINGYETRHGNNRKIFLDNVNWLLSN